jgi:hypothetical protein
LANPGAVYYCISDERYPYRLYLSLQFCSVPQLQKKKFKTMHPLPDPLGGRTVGTVWQHIPEYGSWVSKYFREMRWTVRWQRRNRLSHVQLVFHLLSKAMKKRFWFMTDNRSRVPAEMIYAMELEIQYHDGCVFLSQQLGGFGASAEIASIRGNHQVSDMPDATATPTVALSIAHQMLQTANFHLYKLPLTKGLGHEKHSKMVSRYVASRFWDFLPEAAMLLG